MGSESLEKHMDDLTQALRFADEMLRARKSDVHELNIGFSFPSLNRAAWQTAERTGALGFMDYDEVKEFSELYELQDLVADSQRQLLVRLSGLTAMIAGAGGDPTKASAQDLQVFRSRLLDADRGVGDTPLAGRPAGGRLQEDGAYFRGALMSPSTARNTSVRHHALLVGHELDAATHAANVVFDSGIIGCGSFPPTSTNSSLPVSVTLTS